MKNIGQIIDSAKRNKRFKIHNSIINNLHITIMNSESMMRLITCYHELSLKQDGDYRDRMNHAIKTIRDLKCFMAPIGDDISKLVDDFLDQIDE